ncbi:DNA helicase [Sarracenia purpurea var. burkii]
MEEAFLTNRIPTSWSAANASTSARKSRTCSPTCGDFNPRDDVSFRRSINTPVRGIGPTAISKLEEWANERNASLWTPPPTKSLQAGLPKKTASSVRAFVSVIADAQELAEQGPVTPVLRSLLSASGYVDALKAEHSQEALGRLENLQELLKRHRRIRWLVRRSLAWRLLGERLSRRRRRRRRDLGRRRGHPHDPSLREGSRVPRRLHGRDGGRGLPHSRSLGSDTELEEERRLAYVGMTRAREELHLMHAARRSLYGTPNFNRRSRFLDDIPSHLLDTLNPAAIAPPPANRSPTAPAPIASCRPRRSPRTPPPRSPRPGSPPFDVGQRVKHPSSASAWLSPAIPCATTWRLPSPSRASSA